MLNFKFSFSSSKFYINKMLIIKQNKKKYVAIEKRARKMALVIFVKEKSHSNQ